MLIKLIIEMNALRKLSVFTTNYGLFSQFLRAQKFVLAFFPLLRGSVALR